ncbi:MAG: helix-turn-helix domain-containing protein [Clostridia bacterium]|nr:helix-turn-helix domain-containing protein [Clostridia bacterium]
MRRSEYIKMLKAYPDVLRIEQVCEILGGISTKTGYKMLKSKKIDCIKVGREYRVTKLNIVDFLMKSNN